MKIQKVYNKQRRRECLMITELEDNELIFRNLSGRPTEVNKKGGVMTFAIAFKNYKAEFPDDVALACDRMFEEGWNIRVSEKGVQGSHPYIPGAAYDYDTQRIYLSVEARFNNFPPDVHIIVEGKGRDTLYSEEMMPAIDSLTLHDISVELSPRRWDDNGIERIKAFLATMWAVAEPNPYEERYGRYMNATAEPVDDELDYNPFM